MSFNQLEVIPVYGTKALLWNDSLQVIDDCSHISLKYQKYPVNSDEDQLQNILTFKLSINYKLLSNKQRQQFVLVLSRMKNLIDLALNLAHHRIKESSVIRLFVGIQSLKCLKTLSLDLNGSLISVDKFDYFDQMITSLNNLQNLTLNLSDNSLKQNHLKVISQALPKLLQLKQLELILQKNQIDDDVYQSLIQGISQLSTLEDLAIDFIRDSSDTQSQLLECLQSLRVLHSLKLTFTDKLFAESISDPLSQIHSLVSLSLNFGDIYLNMFSLKNLSTVIKSQHTLTELNLHLLSHLIENTGMHALTESLSLSKYLNSLSLLVWGQTNSDFIVSMSSAISELSPQLKSLRFNYFTKKYLQINNEVAIHFSSSISKLQNLFLLDLNLNFDIYSNSSIHLQSAITHLANLKVLILVFPKGFMTKIEKKLFLARYLRKNSRLVQFVCQA